MRELDGVGQHGSAYPNNYSAEQNAAYTAQFGEITTKFKQAQIDGLSPSDPLVQDLVKQHYDFCLQFWTPNRVAYKALAQGYLFPTPYRDAYESVNEGLAKYHHDAIVIWADANLT